MEKIIDMDLAERTHLTLHAVLTPECSLSFNSRSAYVVLVMSSSVIDLAHDVIRHSISIEELARLNHFKSFVTVKKHLRLIEEAGYMTATIKDGQMFYEIPLQQKEEVEEAGA